ncbi:MAG: GAF domain-containing protein [Spirochaetales bacterium]|nr:GAF domain-containing protein [Spirochaetales bacterium]
MIILLFAASTVLALFVVLFLRERREKQGLSKALEESRLGYETYGRIGKILSRGAGHYELLELILDECQRLTHADAGTIYLYDYENQELDFAILHTNSRNVRQGGTSGNEIKLPSVPLYKEGKANHDNVCSSCALNEETINIPDIYKEEGYNFSGTKKYDSSNNYRSHSMLVMPMKDLEGKMIGVIQLINAQDKISGSPVSFTKNHEDLISLLTAHAASTLNNIQLTEQLKDLFNSFIKSIGSTIDEKSPYTGHHIERVVKLTMMITQAVNDATEGPFKETHFTDEEREEIRIAAWLHDIGKLTTPDRLINKSTKLELPGDRIELIELRFKLIEHLAETKNEKKLIREELEFLKSCNIPREFMDEDKLTRLEKIAQKTWKLKNKKYPYLDEKEKEYLAIRKGTLNQDEREQMENHVAMTKTILDKLEFPDNLSQVAEYACMHHEKLNGLGYHRALSEKEIPLQARIIAVSDIFEALTARDRPYRKPLGWDEALEIIKKMADHHELDSRLHDLLFSSGVAREYSKQELESPKEE